MLSNIPSPCLKVARAVEWLGFQLNTPTCPSLQAPFMFLFPIWVSPKRKKPRLLSESPRRPAALNLLKYFCSGHDVSCPWLGGISIERCWSLWFPVRGVWINRGHLLKRWRCPSGLYLPAYISPNIGSSFMVPVYLSPIHYLTCTGFDRGSGPWVTSRSSTNTGVFISSTSRTVS